MKNLNFYTFIACLFVCSTSYANDCFDASGKAFSDAQQIRKIAKSMGWNVGKAASMTAGSFIKGKKTVYPQDTLQICIRVLGNSIQFKAQSAASDAGIAEWRDLHGKKN